MVICNPDGTLFNCTWKFKNCEIEIKIGGVQFKVDLIPIDLGSYDVI